MSRLSSRVSDLLYYPVDAPAAPAPAGKEDIIKMLGEDDNDADKPAEVIDLKEKKDEKKDDKKAKDTKDDTDDTDDTDTDDDNEDIEEDDDLAELEEDLEEPAEDKLEFVAHPVSRREILKQYPDLFKKFPYLEKAYYREQQFSQVFPTIPEAKAAAENSKTLEAFEADLTGGNMETILKAVKEVSPKGFNKIADQYLETLSKIDEKAYHHVAGNLIKHVIAQMVQEGRKSKQEVLESAAHILNQYVFGSSEYTPPSRLYKEDPITDSPEKKQLEDEKRSLMESRLATATEEVDERVNSIFKSTVEANIDPKGSMSDYVKKNAIREVLEEVEKSFETDTRFATLVTRLWDDAKKNNFSKDSVDKVRRAFIAKGRTLLPSVIKKARHEALRGMGIRVKNDKDDDSKGKKESGRNKDREDEPQSKKRGQTGGSVPKGMSTIDYLMQD